MLKSVNYFLLGADALPKKPFRYALLERARQKAGSKAALARLLHVSQQNLDYWDGQWRKKKVLPHPWDWILQWYVLTDSPFPTEDEADRDQLIRVGGAARAEMMTAVKRGAPISKVVFAKEGEG